MAVILNCHFLKSYPYDSDAENQVTDFAKKIIKNKIL